MESTGFEARWPKESPEAEQPVDDDDLAKAASEGKRSKAMHDADVVNGEGQ